MSKKLKQIPLEPSRFLKHTHDWSNKEVGAYILLLMHQWEKNELPKDPSRLAVICKVEEDWVLRFLARLDDEVSQLVNGNIVITWLYDKQLKIKEKFNHLSETNKANAAKRKDFSKKKIPLEPEDLQDYVDFMPPSAFAVEDLTEIKRFDRKLPTLMADEKLLEMNDGSVRVERIPFLKWYNNNAIGQPIKDLFIEWCVLNKDRQYGEEPIEPKLIN